MLLMKQSLLKYAQILFLVVYFLLGIFSAHQVGITWDEDAEHTTLLTNVTAINGLYHGDLAGFNKLDTYVDRYNGIGFQILTYPITRIVAPLLTHYTNLNSGAVEFLAVHSCIFICFFLSGIFIQKILQVLLADKLVAWLGMAVYLLWPYLLGHGLMNPKDMPFLLGWLMTTYYLILIYQSPSPYHQQSANMQYWAYLGLAVGWMIALRINGLLLFIVYFISFWISARLLGRKVAEFKKGAILFLWVAILTNFLFTPLFWDSALNVYRAVQFLITGSWDGPPTTPGSYVIPSLDLTYNVAQLSFSPVFWSFPIDFIRALKRFQQVLYQGTTFTAGNFLSTLDLPASYIPLWLSVKLPLLSLLGLVLIPFAVLRNKIRAHALAIPTGLVGITVGVVMIVTALIVRHARLHDELRHILFIFPMLWVIGVCSWYYLSRSIAIGALVLTAILFASDIPKIHPYEYVWFNEPARALQLENQYENDYWATAVGPAHQWFEEHVPMPVQECIYMYPSHLNYYLDSQRYLCVRGFGDTGVKELTPPEQGQSYWIFKSARFRNLEIPSNCKVVHEEKATLTFSSNPITVAQIYHCK
jgi:hypothetical protein